MHTILFGTKTHASRNPASARLLREAMRLGQQERLHLARGLMNLAVKFDSDTLCEAWTPEVATGEAA